jgi:hypothetical protein
MQGVAVRAPVELEGQRHLRLAQRLHAAQGLDLARGHDGQAVHALLQLGQDVRGDDDRHAPPAPRSVA